MYLAENLVSFLIVKRIENLSTIIDKVAICNAMSYFLDHPVQLGSSYLQM